MFTKTVTRTLDLLLGPHGVNRFTELLDPLWTDESRASVVAVRRSTPRSVTLLLAPNSALALRAGQHVFVTVEIDGRRHTRCYSPAGAETDALIELTVARHDGGVVSEFLYRHARPGMVVGLDGPAGDFVLPRPRPRRILLVAGGSGITPVMAMLRTLRDERFTGEIAVLFYVRTMDDACYRDELDAMAGVRVLYGPTRDGGGDLEGHLSREHLAAAMTDPEVVFVCGPPALSAAVHRHSGARVVTESFAPPALAQSGPPTGGRITFRDSATHTTDDGRPLLDQAEAVGLRPKNGCRMGICHTCTRRKLHGRVRNLTTDAVSGPGEEDVQICVSVPVGDVEIAL